MAKTKAQPLNHGLSAAKQDEFHTQYVDIQKEVEAWSKGGGSSADN